ncbi:HTH-type transcriptional regulator IscR [bacterium BMS3Bbin04]|nr:HTH-type transcriptional regulator IscR [bacterium BMS3Bbin04]
MLTTTSEYAIRAVGFLAVYGNGELLKSGDISDSTGIPKRFLQKILNTLKNDGIIDTARGKTGGFRLARQPDDITLFEVINCFEDLNRHAHCPMGAKDCGENKGSTCPMHEQWSATRTSYMSFLRKTTFASFTEENLPFSFHH